MSGKGPSSAGQKGTAGDRSATARKSASGYSAPGHSGGMTKLDTAPKLGRTAAVSGGSGTSYGTKAAKNDSQAGSSGVVSGKSESYGTAPAKNRSSEPYGTWTGK